jgi:hypothetical protein
MKRIKEQDFTLTLPAGDWTNHSSKEAYDFRSHEREQVLIVVHLPRRPLADKELLQMVVDLFKSRLASLQQHSNNSCQFEAPKSDASPGRLRVMISGQDLREKVLFHIGLFGAAQRVVAVSYFDYSHPRDSEKFGRRAATLFSSVFLA